MKSKLLAEGDHGRTYVVVLDPGDEAFGSLRAFAEKERIDGAQVTAIGAFSRTVVGFFEPSGQTYHRITVDEQAEVLSALGDIAADEAGKPSLHMHVVLGISDGSCKGGHLLEAWVYPTLEAIVTETPKALRRRERRDMGVALIDL